LVEHDLAKVGVASSSLVSRSSCTKTPPAGVLFFTAVASAAGRDKLPASSSGRVAEWLCSGLQIRVRRFNSDLGLQIESPAPAGLSFARVLAVAASMRHDAGTPGWRNWYTHET
jgi:hypothetical protein